MQDRTLTAERIRDFACHLEREEKSAATCGKYLRDVRGFMGFAKGRPVTKELVAAYKRDCVGRGYAVRSVNSMLASVNSLLNFLGWQDCKVKNVRLQRRTYCGEAEELTRSDYLRLLEAARGDERLFLVLQTICGAGIRVSELRYFTVEAVREGEITVSCKNKTRTILIPCKLRKALLRYAKREQIISGPVFVGRQGKPLDRSQVWRQMKRLCAASGVQASKVFPHNLRKLFARTFYALEKDIAKLADILGHSSINTTRIYIMTTGTEHQRKLDQMRLIL